MKYEYFKIIIIIISLNFLKSSDILYRKHLRAHSRRILYACTATSTAVPVVTPTPAPSSAGSGGVNSYTVAAIASALAGTTVIFAVVGVYLRLRRAQQKARMAMEDSIVAPFEIRNMAFQVNDSAYAHAMSLTPNPKRLASPYDTLVRGDGSGRLIPYSSALDQDRDGQKVNTAPNGVPGMGFYTGGLGEAAVDPSYTPSPTNSRNITSRLAHVYESWTPMALDGGVSIDAEG